MGEAKHTTGPWELCDRGDYCDFDGHSEVILGDGKRIAVVHSHTDEDHYNALVMWVAPELLEALDACVFVAEHGEVLAPVTIARYKELIAKAEGRNA
jgi:hypothetical protein